MSEIYKKPHSSGTSHSIKTPTLNEFRALRTQGTKLRLRNAAAWASLDNPTPQQVARFKRIRNNAIRLEKYLNQKIKAHETQI